MNSKFFHFQELVSLWLNSGLGCDDVQVTEATVYGMTLLTIFLTIANIVMIYFIVDLTLIRFDFKGTWASQRPKFDYVVCFMKWAVDWCLKKILSSKYQAREQQEDRDEKETVQRQRTFEGSRHFARRNYNRNIYSTAGRRTPRPCMD